MSSASLQSNAGAVSYRKPELSEASGIHTLIRSCPPLDLNSEYAYMLLCTHFADTCAIAKLGEGTAGFASAYRKPNDPNVLFVWQVAVGSKTRGMGIGLRLLTELLSRPACSEVTMIETTIGPSNTGSWALFSSLAKSLDAELNRKTLFHEEDFGDGGHEEEQLLRIGPIDPKKRDQVCKSLTS